ncbi:inter-alpha-trypsin inhibitor heavy chain-related [Euphorbia peplus]|nr:inter-alpha-trypsin inhibitor heavy chain-related [Euphorbia peplus]
MAEEFGKCVEDGIKLSKRLYYGKDRAVVPPRIPLSMEKSSAGYLPTGPMVYAVIPDPAIVDNPDMPSYQPHVHGRCDPPALIPLQMNRIELEADSWLDGVVVRVTGSWRVHCVMGSKSCDCRVAIPMGEQGTILGVEVEVPRKLYQTELVEMDDKMEKDTRPENGGFLTPRIFTMTIPKVDGGSNILIKVSWVQKLLYSNGEFSLAVPFSFPEYVTPAVKKLPKKEKIQLNLNAAIDTVVMCKSTSHPLKQLKREAGKLGFLYEAEVLTWTDVDLAVSYSVSSSHVSGGVFLQSPSFQDVDQREMFCFYLFPGDQPSGKVFRKEIVFLVDISGSMEGKLIEATKNALSAALTELGPKDSFSIIAFNGETYTFSLSMEFATKETVEKAIEWMNVNFIAGGGTNILLPLNQAMEMVSNTHGSFPVIFLVTDGAVEDERHICELMKKNSTAGGSISPRICTFGIGTYCNHHFLRLLAINSRGHYDGAYDVDSVESRLQKLFSRGLSPIIANISIDTLDDLNEVEVFPSAIPDLSGGPLVISGRYQGKFPANLKATGLCGDLSNFTLDLKIHKADDMPFDRIFAKQQIDVLTAEAWFTEDKQLEEKVAKISIQTGVVSEYTRLTIGETERPVITKDSAKAQKASNKAAASTKADMKVQKRILLQKLGVGFGNLTATADNICPGSEEIKLPEAAELIIKAASNCCSGVCEKCCCMCFIQCCGKMNDQCAIALTQLFTALACFGCLECCSLCCSGSDGN